MRRHTMGQDQAGHPPLNPPGAPRVTAGDVLTAARQAGAQVRRVPGMRGWWKLDDDGLWRTLAPTNFLARAALAKSR